MKTLLIVDDDPNNIQIINETFLSAETNKYRVLNANGGTLGLEIATKMLPDVIITDWEMPDMNGIELTKKLRANELTSHIPIVIASGIMITSEDLSIALSAGANDYIRKPIDKVELVARVRSSLELADYIKSIREKNILISEQEKSLFEQEIEKLQREVAFKQRELATNVNFMLQLETEQERLLQELNKLKPFLNTAGKEELKIIADAFREQSEAQSAFELEQKFESMNSEFYTALSQRIPDITKSERTLCAYLKMDLSPAQIATMTKKNTNAIHVSISRIRGKLGLDNLTQLKTVLEELK